MTTFRPIGTSSGDGYGYGYGYDYCYGTGTGYGSGDGSSGTGGYGSGYGYIYGDYGSGDGYGYGDFGDGYGYGYGDGYGYGYETIRSSKRRKGGCMSKYANDLDMMSQALRGELNDCKCCAYGSHECACDAVWPEDVAREAADEIERLRRERDDAIKASMQMQRERDDANKALALAYMSGSYDAKKQLASCQADAARYRWLRSQIRPDDFYSSVGFWEVSYQANGMGQVLRNEKLDAAIDEAMAKVEG